MLFRQEKSYAKSMEKVYINVYNNANNASVESGFQNFVRTISMLKMCYVMEDQSDED